MLDAAGGTAAPLAVCPLVSKNPGGTPKVTPLTGVLAAADCPVCQVTDEFPLPSELKGKTLAEDTGAKLKPVVHVPKDLLHLARDPHQVQWHQLPLVGCMSQGALLALTY